MATEVHVSWMGRKIFFVAPEPGVQKDLLDELIRHEYEVAVIDNPFRTVDILLRFPDSLSFLNLDGLSDQAADLLLEKIAVNPVLKGVKIGIVSERDRPELVRKYAGSLLSCGFSPVKQDLAALKAWILPVLEANHAKGRRDYLRVSCFDYPRVQLQNSRQTVEGHIHNISSVGIACTLFPDRSDEALADIQFLELNLKGNLCRLEGAVKASRFIEGTRENLHVILFNPRTSEDAKSKIRAYIQWVIQSWIFPSS